MSSIEAARGMSNRHPQKERGREETFHHFHYPLQSEKTESKGGVIVWRSISRILKISTCLYEWSKFNNGRKIIFLNTSTYIHTYVQFPSFKYGLHQNTDHLITVPQQHFKCVMSLSHCQIWGHAHRSLQETRAKIT